MSITHVLLGEHGARHPLLSSHPDIEEELQLPAILPYLPKPTPDPNGAIPQADPRLVKGGLYL